MPKNTSGLRRGGGRPPGVPNKVTGAFRHALLDAFHKIGGAKALAEWARQPKNRGAFYTICARLVPTEIVGSGGSNVVVMVGTGAEPIGPNPWDLPRTRDARPQLKPTTDEP